MSSLGQIITAVVAVIVGVVVGVLSYNPYAGFAVFSLIMGIGTALFPAATNKPRPQELQFQTSAYGGTIPVQYGARKRSGNCLWYANYQTHEQTAEGGKGGGSQVTGYTYSISLAFGLCMNTAGEAGMSVSRMWSGKEELNLPAMIAHDQIRIYGGNQTVPDSHMATFVPRVPLYKGLCWVVLPNFDLGNNPHIPNLTFEVGGILGAWFTITGTSIPPGPPDIPTPGSGGGSEYPPIVPIYYTSNCGDIVRATGEVLGTADCCQDFELSRHSSSGTEIVSTIPINSDGLVVSGPDAPTNGSVYSASGGVGPYVWSISKGSITQGGVVTVSGQCGTAVVTCTDHCGNTGTKDVRMPGGVWVNGDLVTYGDGAFGTGNLNQVISGGTRYNEWAFGGCGVNMQSSQDWSTYAEYVACGASCGSGWGTPRNTYSRNTSHGYPEPTLVDMSGSCMPAERCAQKCTEPYNQVYWNESIPNCWYLTHSRVDTWECE